MLLVLILDGMDLQSIVVEEDMVLRVKPVLEVISVKNCLKLPEEFQRVFDTSDVLEVLVNVGLETSLD